MKIKLSKEYILELFKDLNSELEQQNIRGELYLLGGAVMCLQFNARPSTYDVDAVFAPRTSFLKAIKKVAEKNSITEDWLNDGVKGFISTKGTFDNYLDLPNLKIFSASAEYLLAMKCLSMRLGLEFHDESDVRYLLRYLNITKQEEVIKIIEKFYDSNFIPQKTYYAIQEMLE
ncbi:MAG: hypothetical protein JXA66_07640 [Oligoflexia bacterium]|nr:hypothetical protein [Oligoflexia bacterium]